MGRIAKYSRRAFLIGTAAIAGGVAFGVYAAKRPVTNPLEAGEGQVTLNPYLMIDQDGVTVITPRAEMGQGVQTTLAALVAEEMDLDMADLNIHHGPPAAAYFNGALGEGVLPFRAYDMSAFQHQIADAMTVVPKLLGLQVTGGSTSTVDAYEKMRMAGATARETLKLAAAAQLGVDASTLKTEAGAVIAPDGTTLPYTELAEAAAGFEPPSVELRPSSDWKILGKTTQRLDQPGKATGTAEYAIDVRLPGMKFATVRMNPDWDQPMQGFEASAAEAMPGVEKVIDLGTGIGVVANNTWIAIQAANAVEIDWSSRDAPAETDGVFAAMEASLNDDPDSTFRDDGDIDAATSTLIEAEYRVPYLAHATMEPMGATAHLDGDRLTVWTGTQAPILARDKCAEAAGVSSENTTLHTTLMGGGFGRRGEYDAAVYAARIASEMPGTPVQVTWSREEDMTHDFYRPGNLARFRGKVENGKATMLDAKIAGPSVTREPARRMTGTTPPGPDKEHVTGSWDQPYAIPNYRVAGHIADIHVPVGFWRSVGSSCNGFFHNSFLDEMAHAAGVDPLEFHLSMMRDEHAPSAAVVQKVAEMSGWTGQTPDGVGRGLAFTFSFGTPVAEVIEVQDQNGEIHIAKAWIACDVGTAMDPTNVAAQMEGGMIYGLSAAVHGQISFENGGTVEQNFYDYDAVRMHTTPVTEVAVLENMDGISGAGEPGTPPAAGALANALFDLTGERVRELPLSKRFDFKF